MARDIPPPPPPTDATDFEDLFRMPSRFKNGGGVSIPVSIPTHRPLRVSIRPSRGIDQSSQEIKQLKPDPIALEALPKAIQNWLIENREKDKKYPPPPPSPM